MRRLLSILIASLLFAIGCQTKTEVKKDEHSEHTNQNTNQNTATKPTGVFTMEFKANPAEVKAGEKIELTFNIKNSKGETVEDLEVVHEKLIHLLIVSEDLAEFYHEHPEPANGIFKVPFTFKNGGKFKIYADFTPKGSAQMVKSFDLTVSGNERAKETLKADTKFEKTVNDLLVMMKPADELIAGKELTLNFNVSDAKTKKPVTDLQKYLGELAHFVIISQDLQEFVHAHPMSGGHDHGDKMENMETAPTVMAHVSFPKAGLYKVFAQFQRNDKVITVPFVVEVKGDKTTAEHLNLMDVPKDAYRITVSKEGFTPNQIQITKGSFTKLAFVRLDNENCADEVVLKSLNITKKLPLGEVVLVDLPKDFSGELNYACGMDMFKGKIVVE